MNIALTPVKEKLMSIQKWEQRWFQQSHFIQLVKSDKSIVDIYQVAQYLNRLLKLKRKSTEDLRYINCFFANLIQGNEKWTIVSRDTSGKNNWIVRMIDQMIASNMLEQELGSHDVKGKSKATMIRGTKTFWDLLEIIHDQIQFVSIELFEQVKANKFLGQVLFFHSEREINSKGEIYKSMTLIDHKEIVKLLSSVSRLNELENIQRELNIINKTQRQHQWITEPNRNPHQHPPIGTELSHNPSTAKQDQQSSKSFKVHDRTSYTIRFTDDLDHHGRLYAEWQSTTNNEGQRKHWTVNNKATVELDYSAFHPGIIAAQHNLDVNHDFYDFHHFFVDGAKEVRALNKAVIMMMINCQSKQGALTGMRRLLKKEDGFKPEDKTFGACTNMKHLKYILELATEHNKEYVKHWYCGNLKLMNKDGIIARKILLTFSELNKPIRALHDSFIVLEEDEVLLHNLMIQYYQQIIGTTSIPKIKRIAKEILFTDMSKGKEDGNSINQPQTDDVSHRTLLDSNPPLDLEQTLNDFFTALIEDTSIAESDTVKQLTGLEGPTDTLEVIWDEEATPTYPSQSEALDAFLNALQNKSEALQEMINEETQNKEEARKIENQMFRKQFMKRMN